MKNEITKYNHPSLMSCDRDGMAELFAFKLEKVGAEGLADYIGLTLELIQDKTDRIKVAKADLTMIDNSNKGQAEIIKEEVRKLLEANGVDKLTGDRVSSITLFDPAPKKKLVIHDKDFFISEGYTKVTLDETRIKKDIELFDSELCEMEVIHSQPSVRINKRKEV